MTQRDATRFFWIIIAILTVLRLVVAAWAPISPDEAYYWVWSKHLAMGYFDHPPMVAVWIRLGTILFGDTEFGVRCLGALGCVVSTYAVVEATRALTDDARASVMAGVLFNATLMVGIGAVVITPDTPLLMFWCLAVWMLALIQRTGNGDWWLAVGVFSGLALLSKYTAAFLGVGIVCWILLARDQRHWIGDWRLWAGGAIAVVLFSPVIAWNASHDWVSFYKQGGRLSAGGTGDALKNIGELIASQFGLATPLLFILIVCGAFFAVARAWEDRPGAAILLSSLVVPAAGIFLIQSLSDRVQGDWPAILYPAAVISAVVYAPRWAERWQLPGAALGICIALFIYAQTTLGLFPIPEKVDMTLRRMAGWSAFASDVAARYRASGATAVVSEDYGVASVLAFKLPPDVVLVALGPRWKYFDIPNVSAESMGKSSLVVVDRRVDQSSSAFKSLTPFGALDRMRAQHVAGSYHLFRGDVWVGGVAAVQLRDGVSDGGSRLLTKEPEIDVRR